MQISCQETYGIFPQLEVLFNLKVAVGILTVAKGDQLFTTSFIHPLLQIEPITVRVCRFQQTALFSG